MADIRLNVSPTANPPGHYLAIDGSRNRAYVVIGREVFRLSLTDLRVQAHSTQDFAYSSIAANLLTGDVYLGAYGGVIALAGESLRPTGRTYGVNGSYQLAFSLDGEFLYAGGHDNGYVVEIPLAGGPTRQLKGHGGFVAVSKHRLISGDGEGLLWIYLKDSTVATVIDSNLGGHLMEFAATRDGATAVIVGSCLYAGGMVTLAVDAQRMAVVHPRYSGGEPWAGAGSVCAERYALLADELVGIRSRTAGPATSLFVCSLDDCRIRLDIRLDRGLDVAVINGW